MARQRHHYTADFKAKVALVAIKGQQTVNEIAATYGVHPNQVLPWKKPALDVWPDVFSRRRARAAQDDEALQARLYQQIGQLKVELDGLKKKLDAPLDHRRPWVEPHHEQISVRRQCQLLGVKRAGLSYQPVAESVGNLHLMHLLDEPYTRCPLYGVLRMTAWLRQQGHAVNAKRVRRLLRQMGLMAVYPKPRLSQPGTGGQLYPYLLTGVTIHRSDQVWSTDITYVRLWQGFVYLVAIMDWYSRYVLSWEVAVTLDSDFCVSALERALISAQPEIFNSDQGAQFTSVAFTERLLGHGIRISMDGRGRVFDNIFVARLWRSMKYEEVYSKDYRSVQEAINSLRSYWEFYNRERLHHALNYQTPETVYRQGRTGAAAATLH